MGVPMFVPFKSALTSRLLFVNSSLVRTVVDGPDGPGQDLLRLPTQRYSSRCGNGSSTKIDGRIGADRAGPRIASPGGFDTRAEPLISPRKIPDPLRSG